MSAELVKPIRCTTGPAVRSDRRTCAGRADDRGVKMQVTLQLDHRLVEEVDAAARYRATSRVALIAAGLSERLGQDAPLGLETVARNLMKSYRT